MWYSLSVWLNSKPIFPGRRMWAQFSLVGCPCFINVLQGVEKRWDIDLVNAYHRTLCHISFPGARPKWFTTQAVYDPDVVVQVLDDIEPHQCPASFCSSHLLSLLSTALLLKRHRLVSRNASVPVLSSSSMIAQHMTPSLLPSRLMIHLRLLDIFLRFLPPDTSMRAASIKYLWIQSGLLNCRELDIKAWKSKIKPLSTPQSILQWTWT